MAEPLHLPVSRSVAMGLYPEQLAISGQASARMSIASAKAAGKIGLRTIGMLCGGFSEEDLRAADCVAIYRDPAHLLEEYETSILGAGGLPD